MKLLHVLLAMLLLLPAAFAQQSAPPPFYYVEVKVQGRGSFTMELYAERAPKLVAHFLDLVNKKFYDGMLWHRKVNNFVIQTGDPASKKVSPEQARKKPGEMGGTEGLGDGGSGTTVPFEINDLRHAKYMVGMALESPMSDTGDSQFFVNLKDNFRLDGSYCVFGRVAKGMDIIDKIERGDKIIYIKKL